MGSFLSKILHLFFIAKLIDVFSSYSVLKSDRAYRCKITQLGGINTRLLHISQPIRLKLKWVKCPWPEV